MTTDDTIRSLPRPDVIARCRDETARFRARRPHDSRYCFELFRRAFEAADQRAWDAIYDCYAHQIERWARRKDAIGRSSDDINAVVNSAFARFWNAIQRNGFDFDKLERLLSYFALCVGAELIDDARRRRRDALDYSDELDVRLPAESDPEATSHLRSIIERCWDGIMGRAKSDEERVYAYVGFRLGFKPKQIHALYPNLYPDVSAVNRTRANFIARLRRDEELRSICGDLFDAGLDDEGDDDE